eukprot:804447-Rhodomonas_salina.1
MGTARVSGGEGRRWKEEGMRRRARGGRVCFGAQGEKKRCLCLCLSVSLALISAALPLPDALSLSFSLVTQQAQAIIETATAIAVKQTPSILSHAALVLRPPSLHTNARLRPSLGRLRLMSSHSEIVERVWVECSRTDGMGHRDEAEEDEEDEDEEEETEEEKEERERERERARERERDGWMDGGREGKDHLADVEATGAFDADLLSGDRLALHPRQRFVRRLHVLEHNKAEPCAPRQSAKSHPSCRQALCPDFDAKPQSCIVWALGGVVATLATERTKCVPNRQM